MAVDAERNDEPSLQAPQTGFETRLNSSLGRAANVLTSAVAVLLIGFVVLVLVGIVTESASALVGHRAFMTTAVRGVSAAFLAIILLELVHITVSRGPMARQLQEFLVIGITVGVRNGLEVAVEAPERGPQHVAVNLVFNAVAVLVLVIALCLVRHYVHPAHPRGEHG